MTATEHDPAAAGAMTPPDFVEHMSQHVMARIGMTAAPGDDGGRSMTLTSAPATTTPDGHVDFGVLGVFFDMAASAGFDPPRGGVHADIAITRLAPGRGTMTATPRQARQGSRTGVVEVDLHDEDGTLVATSTQEIVFREMPGVSDEQREEAMAGMRERFRALFDGVCRLEAPLDVTLGVERRGDSWHMGMGPDRTNGGGALHGGCGIAFVESVVRQASSDVLGSARTLSTAVRYLAPARVGPFTATAEITGVVGDVAVTRIRVTDDGQDGRAVILADAQAVRA